MRVTIIISLLLTIGCDEKRGIITPKVELCKELSAEELINRVYADTLAWKGDSSTIAFYKPYIERIAQKVRQNCSSKSCLVYPYKPFDSVICYKGRQTVFGKDLSQKQIRELIEVINNPLNFSWGETTFERDHRIIFELKGKEVARIDLMDNWVLEEIPENRLMKFGDLNGKGYIQLKGLLK